ncbi:MAG: hypothetical protein HC925_00230 [Coleofasciculaceae cyanobacterium SM2_3_26]|nr:hypothetical protein [Coleofasciculaceae cyanobacterium SM2_3_26]
MRLIVEGWRAIPHSYAVINQFQLLDMIQRPDLQVFHRDMPYITQDWKPVRGLLGETAEAALAAIPQPAPQQDADATLRVYCPFNFTPGTTPKNRYLCRYGMGDCHPGGDAVNGGTALAEGNP